MIKVAKVLLVLGIISRLVVFVQLPSVIEILLYTVSVVIVGFFIKLSNRNDDKKTDDSIIFGLALFCSSPLIAFGNSTPYTLATMVLVSVLSMMYMSSKNKLIRNLLLLLTLLSIVIIPLVMFNEFLGVGIKNTTYFSEPGMINDVNQLRGEDESALVGKLLHNKSIYLYKYLENIATFISPAYLIENFLLVSLIPLMVGTYVYFKERKKYWELFVTWILTALVLIGFLSIKYWPFYLTLMLPVLTLFMVQGMKTLRSKYLWILLVINFIYAFILNVII